MMALTPKQEKFCLEYLKDGNASRAYREAYNVTTTNESTINSKASHLLKEYKISTRIDELRKATTSKEIDYIKKLKDFWCSILDNTITDDEPKLNDRLKASELLAKSEGIFSETRKNELSGELSLSFKTAMEKALK